MNYELLWISLTAISSWALVALTFYLVREQIKVARNDLEVHLQTNFEEKFQSQLMIMERKKLATQILSQASHEEIQEPIMNFFETIGMYLKRGYFDKEMAWVGFGYYAIRWWAVCKDYVFEERKRNNNDNTIFEGFESLVDQVFQVEIKDRKLSRAELEPNKDDLNSFLTAERDRLLIHEFITKMIKNS
jgi:hypothetical protein